MKTLLGLNEKQLEAANHTEGPLLVLAGAGSGKTKVLTERIAKLISKDKIPAYNILSVTFTNKAAKEMKERIANKIGEEEIKSLWIGTFHSICNKLLRIEFFKLGLNNNFVIYDSKDQKKLLKECIKELNLDETKYSPNIASNKISTAKSNGVSHIEYGKTHLDYEEQNYSEIYRVYQEELLKNNALDFDDLLFYAYKILQENPERLEYYQNKFRYILVDEYQDTNQIQFKLISLLADKNKNVFVVGDVDQSIYSFRNADFRIILNFKENYPNAKIIKLEQNYRSTQNILNLANIIIANNDNRFPKKLYSNNEKGDKITIIKKYKEGVEIDYILSEIKNLVRYTDINYSDIAILYRTNDQSRAFEEKFVNHNIPHKIIGGFRFFERKEIKDIISYLKIIYNPRDNINLQRIINTPKRSIGKTTVEKLLAEANKKNYSLWKMINNLDETEVIGKGAKNSINKFTKMMNYFIDESKNTHISRLIQIVLDDTNFWEEAEKQDLKKDLKGESDVSKKEYLFQLINSAKQFEVSQEQNTLSDYLTHVSLISDTDSLKNDSGQIKLMTVHSSKGLEFPIVFISGLAEGIFPHERSIRDDLNDNTKDNIEEERRLMYVAVTRAKKKLYLTFAENRFMNGFNKELYASRFIAECSPDLVSGYTINPEMHRRLAEQTQNRGSRRRPSNYTSENYLDSVKKPAKKVNYSGIQSSLEKNYSKKPESTKARFIVGQRVNNKKFGKGSINKIISSPNKLILFVDFDDHMGFKIIDPKLSTIEII